ncbi:MAG: hypothetical protein ACREU8_12370, partial [Gammaproteobacteria bacterium]
SFFDPERLKGSAAEENPILFAKVFHRYHYMGLYHLLPWPLRGWCRRHLFNVVRKIDFGLLKVDPAAERPRVSAALRREALREFRGCLASRVLYEGTGCRIGRRPGPGHALRVARAWWKGLD